MESTNAEQIYSILSLVFGLLSIISLGYMISMFPKPNFLIAVTQAPVEIVVRIFHTVSILGMTTSILSIVNHEKTSWIKVMGISINALVLLFNIAGIILYLIFR